MGAVLLQAGAKGQGRVSESIGRQGQQQPRRAAGFEQGAGITGQGRYLVVCKLACLGRSLKSLIDLAGDLHRQGIHLKSLGDAIDTDTPSGGFFFQVIASLSDMERQLTVERTRTGRETARRMGRIGGRKRLMTQSKIESARQLLASGVPPKDVALDLGVSLPTLYRWLPASSNHWL
jgi:DNA invertase Pin-like site-specific DNA recombinase